MCMKNSGFSYTFEENKINRKNIQENKAEQLYFPQ